MEELTMDYDKFTRVLGGNGKQFTRDDFISYDDVYNIWYAITTKEMRKDPHPVVSAIKWMEEIEAGGNFTYYDKNDRTLGTYFGFASLWQLDQLRLYGRTLCFDGTHNVFGQNTNLFTLVLKNLDTGLGIPVAFLMTKSTESPILSGWLKAIRQKMKSLFSSTDSEYDLKPNVVITDQGNTEILAVRTAFPGVPIYYCAWHVLKVWERGVKLNVEGIGHYEVSKRREIKREINADLCAILYEKEMANAFELIDNFRSKWKHQAKLVSYLNKNYFGRDMSQVSGDAASNEVEVAQVANEPEVSHGKKKATGSDSKAHNDIGASIDRVRERWMLCYRQGVTYSSIDTNNYIESWHNTLKRYFFKDSQQRRPDSVIYYLYVMALRHFQKKCMRSFVGVGRMNPAQREAVPFKDSVLKHVQARSSKGYTGLSITQVSDTVLRVESFTCHDKTYNIIIDFTMRSHGHIISCACEYFRANTSICKHIALVMTEIDHLTFYGPGHWGLESNFDSMMLRQEGLGVEDDLKFEFPEIDRVALCIERLSGLESLRDRKKEYLQEETAFKKLQEALEYYEATFPRKEGHDYSNKRKRQR
ncbi:hypothetical protein BGZ76_009984 [Entomortierella beljakovae]|nr:hypothetical protein BGZ76_009984 [Entomortierella beljakovae]